MVLNEVLLEKIYLLSNEYPQDIGLFDWSLGFSSGHLDWECCVEKLDKDDIIEPNF